MNKEKLVEMIVFFTYENPLTDTELIARLSLADFRHFAYVHQSISGMKYFKYSQGLWPAPPFGSFFIDLFWDTGELVSVRSPYGDLLHLATRPAELSVFSTDELYICQDVLLNPQRDKWPFEFLGWQDAQDGEWVPYETIWLGMKNPVISQDTIDWGIKISKEFQL